MQITKLMYRKLCCFVLAAAVFLPLLIYAFACGLGGSAARHAAHFVELVPVALDPRNEDQIQFGRLTLMSAFELRSEDARFGGISGATFGSDDRLYLVSDNGYWLSAQPEYRRDGKLIGLRRWQLGPLLTPQRSPTHGLLTDAESVARSRDGSFLVSFEQNHRIWRYPSPPEAFRGPAESVATPHELRQAGNNRGLECTAVLPDGRIFTVTEGLTHANGTYIGWFIASGDFQPFNYRPAAGYQVSDCASLNDGAILMLERAYAFPLSFSARLVLLRPQQIQARTTLSGEAILSLESPLLVDNFEAVAVDERGNGTMIFLASDNNFFTLQKTLLLQFFWPKTAQR